MSTTQQTTETTSPSRGRRRRLGALTVSGVAVLALSLGACGGGDDSAAPATSSSTTASPATELSAFQVVQASAKQSQEAGSAKFSLNVDGSTGGTPVQLSGEGSFDADAQAVQMAVTLPAQAGGGEVTLRMVGGSVYLSGAPMTAQGQWMQVPLDAAASSGLDTSQLDPTKALEQLQAVAEDVQEVPAVNVRGVQAKGYSGTIDAAKAVAALPAEQQTEEAKAAAAEIGSVPFTLYVDDQNRPVRMTEQVEVDETSTVSISMDYYDWGSDVDIAAPDAGSVTQVPGTAATAAAATGA